MLYELRVYTPAEGKMERLQARFPESVVSIFRKYSIEPIGFWEDRDGKLVYLVRFRDKEHRKSAWRSFAVDTDWLQVQEATEKDGPLVTDVNASVLSPTNFSPLT